MIKVSATIVMEINIQTDDVAIAPCSSDGTDALLPQSRHATGANDSVEPEGLSSHPGHDTGGIPEGNFGNVVGSAVWVRWLLLGGIVYKTFGYEVFGLYLSSPLLLLDDGVEPSAPNAGVGAFVPSRLTTSSKLASGLVVADGESAGFTKLEFPTTVSFEGTNVDVTVVPVIVVSSGASPSIPGLIVSEAEIVGAGVGRIVAKLATRPLCSFDGADLDGEQAPEKQNPATTTPDTSNVFRTTATIIILTQNLRSLTAASDAIFFSSSSNLSRDD